MRLLLFTLLLCTLPTLAPEAQTVWEQPASLDASGEIGSVVLLDRATVAELGVPLPPEATVAFGEYGGVTLGQRVVLVGSALGSGAVGFYLIGPLAPVAIVGGVYGAGRALGLDASLKDVLWDSAIGAGVGLATFAGTTFYYTVIEGQANDFGVSILSLITGVSAFALVTPMLYEARPAVLTSPESERIPGLSLSVRL